MSEAVQYDDEHVLAMRGVGRRFRQGGREIVVLSGCHFTIRAGEIVGLVGPSGAGKSTLLHIAGLLERPDEGEVYLAGKPCYSQSDSWRTLCRRQEIGFVYQLHRLLEGFSAQENIMIPQMLSGHSRRESERRAGELLQMIRLSERASHRPSQLSGGEQQRIAIARALANAPSLLLADEPTGNLDPETAREVFAMMSHLVHQTNMAALVVTHNQELALSMDRVMQLRLWRRSLAEGPGRVLRRVPDLA